MNGYSVEAITHYESGSSTTRSIPGSFESRGDALSAAMDYGQELAGPVREDYRRPTVSIVTDDVLGVCVQVGNADVDPSYTLIYAWTIAAAQPTVSTGRGYVACKL